VFDYQNQEFTIAAGAEDSRTIKMVSSKQPSAVQLYTRLVGRNDRYFVKNILQTKGGASFYIVIGNNCKFCFSFMSTNDLYLKIVFYIISYLFLFFS